MHQRLVSDIVKNLDGERSTYFTNVLTLLEQDGRVQLMPNLIYATLREIVTVVPPYLPVDQFVTMLVAFVCDNSQRISQVMFSSGYVTDSSVLSSVTNELVEQIVEAVYQMNASGEIETEEQKVRSYSWPYNNADFPFAD